MHSYGLLYRSTLSSISYSMNILQYINTNLLVDQLERIDNIEEELLVIDQEQWQGLYN